MPSKELLKEIITENKKFIIDLPDIISRRNIPLPPDNINKAVILYGVRRSGKSFILYDIFKKHPDSSLYIDFEDERLSDIKTEDMESVRSAFFELNPHLINDKNNVYFLFDEIQNIANWEKFVRRMAEKENIHIFCAGSSSKITPYKINTSLRGRSWSVETFPFSFKELLELKLGGYGRNIKTPDIFYGDNKIVIKKYLSEYLQYGGFPEIILAGSEFEKTKLLREYLDAMFFKDLIERFDVKNIKLIDALKNKLFSSFSTKLSLASVYRQYKDNFPFSKDSLYSYYNYFLDSMLIYETRKFTESVYKRTRNPAKIYLADNGLCKRTTSPDFGRLLENLTFIELKKNYDEIFYFEGKRECDFIVSKSAAFSVFQVCYELNDSNRDRELEGLVEAAESLGLKEGIVITYDVEDHFVYNGININVTPFWKWALR